MKEAHKAAVRCIVVDIINDIILSGGKDATVLFLKIENHKIVCFNDVSLAHWEKS